MARIVEHVLEGEDLECAECGEEMTEYKVESTRVLVFVPAHFEVEEHRRHHYKCGKCCAANAEDGSAKAQMKAAQPAALPIPKSFASPSLLAHIAYEKYVNALPINGVSRDLERTCDLAIGTNTMSNWMIAIAERWFSLIYGRMRARILSGDIIHCDETTTQVLREPNREAKQKSQMWVFATPSSDVPCVVYEYHETRRKEVALAFFEGWSGYAVHDGYAGYFGIPGVVNVSCLAHIRRRFFDIVKAEGGFAKAAASGSVAAEAVRRIAEIYHLDNSFAEGGPEARLQLRRERLAPLLTAFGRWVEDERARALGRSKLKEALDYAFNHWRYVMNVLEDGRLPLDNNRAERYIRPYTVGRRRWLFSDSPRGAHASATIYSVVVTAMANGIKPREYMEWLLSEMPKEAQSGELSIDRFLPWSPDVPDSCRMAHGEREAALEAQGEPLVDGIDEHLLD